MNINEGENNVDSQPFDWWYNGLLEQRFQHMDHFCILESIQKSDNF